MSDSVKSSWRADTIGAHARQRRRRGVRRAAEARATPGHDRRQGGVADGHDDREGTRPEAAREPARRLGQIGLQRLEGGQVCDQQRDAARSGEALGLAQARERAGRARVGPQAVDGLGGVGNQLRVGQQLGGLRHVDDHERAAAAAMSLRCRAPFHEMPATAA